MNHEESKLQQQCVAWFRAQHREYASLLTHPINEGGANTRVSGAIHKGEGTVAGVPDLLLFVPAQFDRMFCGLGLEMKTPCGRQSQQQKDFQQMFQAAGYGYMVIRSLNEFRAHVNNWLDHVPEYIREAVASTHKQLADDALRRDREKLQRIIKNRK
jgi:hypothetical protein